MPTVHDVARYILGRRSMTAMKMQKLVYYAQAWHLARIGEALFEEPIEAWVNGPVVRELYHVHRGQFSLSGWPLGNDDALNTEQHRLLDEILSTYGERGASWLSDLTHSETPWRAARTSLPENVRSTAAIDPGVMRDYYATAEANGRPPSVVTTVTNG